MRSLWLKMLAVSVLLGSVFASSTTAGGLLDAFGWSRGGLGCGPGVGSRLNPLNALKQLAGSECGQEGYPAAAAPYPGYGPPSVPNQWAGGGTGYSDMGGTCCGPHMWDFMAEAVFLRREFSAGDEIGLMSQGIQGLGPPNLVQTTSSNDFNFEPGFRVGGRFQMSAVHSLEAIYLGGLDWDDRDQVTTPDHDLFSAFSDFGNMPFGGFEDSDQASIATLLYDSELDSVELNYRRAWMLPDQRTTGSILCGLRYVRIDEALNHRIDVLPHFDPINMVDRFTEFTEYDIATRNHLIGFQTGAEIVRCLSPGILFGGEIKGGLFGNNASQDSVLNSTTLSTTEAIVEGESDTGLAFMTDARAFLLWQFHPLWKLKVGYEAMLFSQVATASSNYNPNPPFLNGPNSFPIPMPLRVVGLDDHDTALYHGFHIGFEMGW